MKKVLKWIGIALAGLLGVVLVAAIALLLISEVRINRSYDIVPEALAFPSSKEALARGRYLEEAVLDCTFCHGEDLGGGVVIDEPGLLTVYAPNLTAGQGGVGARFSNADWVRAVRHGVDQDGKSLMFMPADIFNHLSAEDLAAVIAYVQSFPPVDNQAPESEIGLVGRIFFALGQLPEFVVVPATVVDHDAALATAVTPAISAEYGKYLVSIAYCVHCHGEQLSGGPFPFPEPNAPSVPNITSAGNPGRWSEEQFRETLRTGITPEGRALDAEFMPWSDYKMTDEELKAVWLYLQSLTGDSN